MIIVRLLPLIFAQLLLAAHIMRSQGLIWAIIVLFLLMTLFIRRGWIIRFWQIIIGLAAIEWIRTTLIITHLRINIDMPYTRMLVIMIAVILYNLFVIYWLQRPVISDHYCRTD
ncbi:MAG: hypothetical protein P8X42_04000 [Calditrichaceae bacterium]|jgi:hypothetical protein